jgi:hypothetical protein
MGGRRNPRCLVEPLQKLKNRKPKPINAVAVRTQDIKVRSMLMRVRNQAKCVGTSPLTSNLPVPVLCSLSAMRLNPQEPTVGAAHALCFAKLKSPHSYLFTRTMQRKPRWQVEVSMGWGMRAAGR